MTGLNHSPIRQSTTDQSSVWMNRALVLDMIRRNIELPSKWRVVRLTILRVFPTKHSTFGAQYRLSLRHPKHGTVFGSIYLSPNTKQVQRRAAKLKVAPKGAFVIMGLSLPIDDGNLLLHTPDHDPHLPSLRIAASTRTMTRTLELGYTARCECLSYRPGRRCTLAYIDEQRADRFVVGKVFGNGIYETTPAVHRRVRAALRAETSCSIEVPRPLRSLESLRMVVFSGVKNGHFAGHEKLPEAAGCVLAALHRIRRDSERRFDRKDESHTIQRWSSLVQRLRPSDPMPPSLQKWLKNKERNLPRSRGVFLHRDFYDAQLIATPKGWAVVDLDTVCIGDRELDVANFISHHLWNGVQAGSLKSARRESATFLRSYLQRKRGSTHLNASRLQFYLVGSLARVSLIHSLRTGQEVAANRLMNIAKDFAALSAARCHQLLLSPEE